MDIGATVWALVNGEWRTAIVTGIRPGRRGDVATLYFEGLHGSGFKKVAELRPRDPELRGKDRPIGPA